MLSSRAFFSLVLLTSVACSVEATTIPGGDLPPTNTPPTDTPPTTNNPPVTEKPPVPTKWEKTTTPVAFSVSSISSTGSDDAWAVGSDSTQKAVVLHYNGSAWTQETFAATTPATAVYAASKDRVFITTNYPGAVHMKTATGWTKTDLSGVSSTNALFGIAPDNVWVATQWNFNTMPLRKFNGTSWQQQSVPGQNGIISVWASSATDVWAINAAVTTTMFHSTGAAYTANGPANMLAVYGTAKDDVWAVGEDGAIQHFDGTEWKASTSGTTEKLSAVWASGKKDAWAGGASVLLHWDGTAWSKATNDGAPTGADNLYGTGQADAWATRYGEIYKLSEKK